MTDANENAALRGTSTRIPKPRELMLAGSLVSAALLGLYFLSSIDGTPGDDSATAMFPSYFALLSGSTGPEVGNRPTSFEPDGSLWTRPPGGEPVHITTGWTTFSRPANLTPATTLSGTARYAWADGSYRFERTIVPGDFGTMHIQDIIANDSDTPLTVAAVATASTIDADPDMRLLAEADGSLTAFSKKSLFQRGIDATTGGNGWLGFDWHRTLVAIGAESRTDRIVTFERKSGKTQIGLVAPEITIAPHQKSVVIWHVSSSDKQMETLQHIAALPTFNRLPDAIDYGYFRSLALLMLSMIQAMRQWFSAPWWVFLCLPILLVRAPSYLSSAIGGWLARSTTHRRLGWILRHLPMLLELTVLFGLTDLCLTAIEPQGNPLLWVPDITAPDPLSLFNAFGRAPWAAPNFIHLAPSAALLGLLLLIFARLNRRVGGDRNVLLEWLLPLGGILAFSGQPAAVTLVWTLNTGLSVIAGATRRLFVR